MCSLRGVSSKSFGFLNNYNLQGFFFLGAAAGMYRTKAHGAAVSKETNEAAGMRAALLKKKEEGKKNKVRWITTWKITAV